MDPYYNLGNDDLLLRVLRLSDLRHAADDIAEVLRLPRELVRLMVLDAQPSPNADHDRLQ